MLGSQWELTVGRKTAKNLDNRRENWKKLTVSNKKNFNRKNYGRKNKCSRSRLKTQCILNLMKYETFWDLVEREKPTLSFFSKLEVLEVSVEQCRSTNVLMALTIFRPSPVSSAGTRVLFPTDQIN